MQITVALLQPCDFEKVGVTHVGERVMLMSLAKEQQSIIITMVDDFLIADTVVIPVAITAVPTKSNQHVQFCKQQQTA